MHEYRPHYTLRASYPVGSDHAWTYDVEPKTYCADCLGANPAWTATPTTADAPRWSVYGQDDAVPCLDCDHDNHDADAAELLAALSPGRREYAAMQRHADPAP